MREYDVVVVVKTLFRSSSEDHEELFVPFGVFGKQSRTIYLDIHKCGIGSLGVIYT